MNIGFFIGALLPTFLLSRLFLYILKNWAEEKKKIYLIHGLSLLSCAFIGGMGMADGGAFVPMKALVSYIPAQLTWLAFDFFRLSRKTSSSEKSEFNKDAIALGENTETFDALEENVSESGDLSEEDNEKFAKGVLLVQTFCKLAESHIEGQDGSGSEMDIYEQEQLEKKIKKCLSTTQEISDDFYKSAALHSISDLLSKAGQYDRAEKIIELIPEDFIQEKAKDFLIQQKKNNLSKL